MIGFAKIIFCEAHYINLKIHPKSKAELLFMVYRSKNFTIIKNIVKKKIIFF